MIAKLWADEIIEGRREFKEVPIKLKAKVRNILIDLKKEDFIIE